MFQKINLTVCVLAVTLVMGSGVASADTVILSNGDTISGKVLEQNKQTVSIKNSILGVVTIARSNVKSVNIKKPTDTKAAKKTRANPAGSAVPVHVKPEKNEKTATEKAPESETKKTPELNKEKGFFDSAFFQGWKTQLALGFSGSAGNTESQSFNAEFKTRKETEKYRWLFDAQYFYGSDSGTVSQNQFSAKLTHDWLFKDSPWLVFANVEYDYDQFQSWQSRISGYGGVGYTFIKGKDLEVTGRLGFGGTQHLGGDREFIPEAVLGGTAAHWRITKNQTLNLANSIYPALNDLGRFRDVLEASWQIKIDEADGLSLKLGIQNEYDSHVSDGDKHNNFNYFGALVFGF